MASSRRSRPSLKICIDNTTQSDYESSDSSDSSSSSSSSSTSDSTSSSSDSSSSSSSNNEDTRRRLQPPRVRPSYSKSYRKNYDNSRNYVDKTRNRNERLRRQPISSSSSESSSSSSSSSSSESDSSSSSDDDIRKVIRPHKRTSYNDRRRRTDVEEDGRIYKRKSQNSNFKRPHVFERLAYPKTKPQIPLTSRLGRIRHATSMYKSESDEDERTVNIRKKSEDNGRKEYDDEDDEINEMEVESAYKQISVFSRLTKQAPRKKYIDLEEGLPYSQRSDYKPRIYRNESSSFLSGIDNFSEVLL